MPPRKLKLPETFDAVGVPAACHSLYSLLWELEWWFRHMVYVELRAKYPDWEARVKAAVRDWPPKSREADKRMHHMSTSHQSALSYISLGQLLGVMKNDWDLFEQQLMPRSVFESRVEEVSQLRHRVAHFRQPAETDLDRLKLFLRDIDAGVWRFCTSYCGNGGILPTGATDAVTEHFVATHSQRHIVEMLGIGRGVDYATQDRASPGLGFSLHYSVRPWAVVPAGEICSTPGIVYHARFTGIYPYRLQVLEVLENTLAVHRDCMHIRVEPGESIEVSVPSVIGQARVVQVFEAFLKVAASSIRRSEPTAIDFRKLTAKWPEYVLPGTHPLGFLADSMPCRMFSGA